MKATIELSDELLHIALPVVSRLEVARTLVCNCAIRNARGSSPTDFCTCRSSLSRRSTIPCWRVRFNAEFFLRVGDALYTAVMKCGMGKIVSRDKLIRRAHAITPRRWLATFARDHGAGE